MLVSTGKYEAVNFTSLGPAGIFALYSNPADPVGLVFLNELVSVCDHFEPLTASSQTPNLNRTSSSALLFLRVWTRPTSLRLQPLFRGSSV